VGTQTHGESGNSQPSGTTNHAVGGRCYRSAAGRYSPKQPIHDHAAPSASVISGTPTATEFLGAIQRELKIRFYQPRTIKSYQQALRNFLSWFGRPPHQVEKEDVRCFLEVLVDGGASSSWVSVHLSAIRTAFDKMCGRSVTFGLVTPRRRKKLPVVLSQSEVTRLIEAARSLRDKLLISLMYATGVRVSEVSRLRWKDVDLDRQSITIWEGKGRKDRIVMLPLSLLPLLRQMSNEFAADDYVFPAEVAGRHLSPRTVQRIVKRATCIAGIAKDVTPHVLRHAFATHLIENGTDIRFIQKLLGHANLETTTIYTRVAALRRTRITSPLDVLHGHSGSRPDEVDAPAPATDSEPTTQRKKPVPSVGRMTIHVTRRPLRAEGSSKDLRQSQGMSTSQPQHRSDAASQPNPPHEVVADCQLVIQNDPQPVVLDGIVLKEARPGWIAVDLPPEEHWEPTLRWLNRQQRERLASAEFFDYLRLQVSHRFLKLLE